LEGHSQNLGCAYSKRGKPHMTVQAWEGATTSADCSRFQRILLFLVPPLAVLGPLVPIAGPLFGFRLVVIVLMFSLIIAGHRSGKSPVPGVLWSVIGLFVLSTVGHMLLGRVGENGWGEVASVATGLALVIAVLTLGAGASVLRPLLSGWLAAFMLTAVIAGLELSTGLRMPNHLIGRDALAVASESAPASTLGNPNDYALLLVLAVVPLVTGFHLSRRRGARRLYFVALASTPLLVYATQSRLGLVLIVIIFAALLLPRIPLASLIAAPLVAALMLIAIFTPATVTRLIDVGVADWSGFFLGGGSGAVRANLVSNGLAVSASSGFLGVGPGGFPGALADSNTLAFTAGITSPHSGVIEVLAQYGFIGLLVAILWFRQMCGTVWAAAPWKVAPATRTPAVAVILLLVLAPVWSLMTSTTLSSSVLWVFLATVASLSQTLGRSVNDAVPGQGRGKKSARADARDARLADPVMTAGGVRPLGDREAQGETNLRVR
jgi:O-antigen ligase